MKLNNRKLHESCGVFATGPTKKVGWVVYNALHALQHRGQDGAGLAWACKNKQVHVKRGTGLVEEVFSSRCLNQINNQAVSVIGHVRYATHGRVNNKNNHPFLFLRQKTPFAIAHNGQIANFFELQKRVRVPAVKLKKLGDTEVLGCLIAQTPGKFETALKKVLRMVEGAFNLVLITPTATYGVRDKWGFRPFVLGKKKRCYMLASESVAFDVVGAKLIRDVKPGEIVKITVDKMTSDKFAVPASPGQLDAMELIYFARPDSVVNGVNVAEFRKKTGYALGGESPAPNAEIVVPVPDSALLAGQGFARKVKKPYEFGLVKNRYVARTFIKPGQAQRETSVKRKLNPSPVLKNRNVVIVDDSIVRGTTIRKIVTMVKKAGAKRVDVRVAAPMIIAPSYYGINIRTYSELIAHNFNDPAQISKKIGADSVRFLSLAALKKIANPIELNLSIFTNEYPTNVSPELRARAQKKRVNGNA